MMSTKLFDKFQKNDNVQLPGEAVNIDKTTPIGAALMGSIIRVAQRATDIGDVVNAMKLSNSVNVIYNTVSSPGRTMVVTVTITTVSDGKVTHDIDDPTTLKVYLDNGMTIVSTRTEDLFDG